MRIAAGILMIVGGLKTPPLISSLVEMFGETTNGIFVPLSLLKNVNEYSILHHIFLGLKLCKRNYE